MGEIDHTVCTLRRPLWVTLRVSAVLLAVSVVAPSTVLASCPMRGPICSAYDRAAVVFVGDVASMQPTSGPTRSGVVTRVRFTAVEGLKGAVAAETELVLRPSSEEFDYAVGQRVLVYAWPQESVWSTACTRTRVVSSVDSEVLVLRGLRDKRPGGFVGGYVATIDLVHSRRLQGIRVTVARQGAATREVYTDGNGRFDTSWLETGTYLLSVNDEARGVTWRREVVVSEGSRCVELGSVLSAPQ